MLSSVVKTTTDSVRRLDHSPRCQDGGIIAVPAARRGAPRRARTITGISAGVTTRMKLKAVLFAALLGLVRGDIEVGGDIEMVQQAATPRAAPEGPFAGTGSMLRGGEAFDIGKVADARKLIIPIPPDFFDTNAPTNSPPTGSPTVYGAYWDPRSDSVPVCWIDKKLYPACHCNFYCAASDRHYTYATGQCGGCDRTQCDDIRKLIRVVDVTGGQDCVLDNSRPRPGCKCCEPWC
jgi:hypothetical protein